MIYVHIPSFKLLSHLWMHEVVDPVDWTSQGMGLRGEEGLYG